MRSVEVGSHWFKHVPSLRRGLWGNILRALGVTQRIDVEVLWVDTLAVGYQVVGSVGVTASMTKERFLQGHHPR